MEIPYRVHFAQLVGIELPIPAIHTTWGTTLATEAIITLICLLVSGSVPIVDSSDVCLRYRLIITEQKSLTTDCILISM